MSSTFSEIIQLKHTAIQKAEQVYLALRGNLETWYVLRYVNTSNNTAKDYYMYVTGVNPYIYGNRVYDFDILCNGYICVIKNNYGEFISLDASNDTIIKKVLTQGTSNPDDDPAILQSVSKTTVENDVGDMIHRFARIL